MKFIHIADVHLGVMPDREMPWAKRRQEQIRQSFFQVLDLTQEQQIPLLLIAGDLFHRQPLKRELRELNLRFAQMRGTQVVFCAGNHDYLHPKSYYRGFPWASNVHFLGAPTIQSVYLEQLHTTVYGSSYWSSQETEDCYSDCHPNGQSGYHILLLHGGDAKHRPFSVSRLKQAGFDYVACGHIHQAGHLVRNRMVMAGALEPTDCNDFGSHGYWMGELKKDSCEMSFFPIRNCQYVPREIPVNPSMGMYQLQKEVEQILSGRSVEEISHLRFTGYRDPEMEIDRDVFNRMKRVVSVMDETIPAFDLEQLKRQYADGLIGKFIAQMEQYPDQELARAALHYGLTAILQEQ